MIERRATLISPQACQRKAGCQACGCVPGRGARLWPRPRGRRAPRKGRGVVVPRHDPVRVRAVFVRGSKTRPDQSGRGSLASQGRNDRGCHGQTRLSVSSPKGTVCDSGPHPLPTSCVRTCNPIESDWRFGPVGACGLDGSQGFGRGLPEGRTANGREASSGGPYPQAALAAALPDCRHARQDWRMLDAGAIRERLGGRWAGAEVRVLTSVTSTSDVAWAWAGAGCPEGTAVFAEEQVRGRGRFGRTWHSPRGRSILVSVVLRPPGEDVSPAHLTALGAVAAAEAIEAEAPLQAEIRWPNDVMLGGRKVAGVLVECRGGRVTPSVIGIGINANTRREEFPGELLGVATSL
ncbi:MAG: biotin--[acetyl-CoA-carboxylase] ligase, partial [Planctomycetes bacterium]|nr:biotin--[acetyl-CoA-carboxylase] ligase [Planctomycetota bacterium]